MIEDNSEYINNVYTEFTGLTEDEAEIVMRDLQNMLEEILDHREEIALEFVRMCNTPCSKFDSSKWWWYADWESV